MLISLYRFRLLFSHWFTFVRPRSSVHVSHSQCCTHMCTYCNLTPTGGVYLGFVWGGGTVSVSAGQVLSPSLTPTNIHLVSSLHSRSETPAWPLPHFPSFCLSVSHLHFDLRRDQLGLPAGKWVSAVWTWGVGGVEGGFKRYLVSAAAASFMGLLCGNPCSSCGDFHALNFNGGIMCSFVLP